MKVKKIKPLWTTIITTANKYSLEELEKSGEIIDTTKTEHPLKEYQKVISVGSMVRNLNPGDIIMINPANYADRKYSRDSIKNDIEGMNPITSYNFPMVEIDGESYLRLQENDALYIIEEYEEGEPDIKFPEKK